MNCPRSACWAGLKSLWWHASQYCSEDSARLPSGSSIGIQTDTDPFSQSVLCNSTLSCEPTRNLFCGHVRPDTIPQPVAESDVKEAFLCVRMEFILAYVDPAGCTTCLDGIDASILYNECRHLHEINAVSFWWSPDVGTSILCILAGWNVEPVEKYRESGSKVGFSYPG